MITDSGYKNAENVLLTPPQTPYKGDSRAHWKIQLSKSRAGSTRKNEKENLKRIKSAWTATEGGWRAAAASELKLAARITYVSSKERGK